MHPVFGWVGCLVGENSSRLMLRVGLSLVFVGVGVFASLVKITAQTGHTGYDAGFGQC